MGGGYAGHTGVDFPVPTGTKVMSAINGIVSAVRHLTYSYGKHVRIQGEGVETIYAHLSSTLARVGQRVTAGQIIGLSGSGKSTMVRCFNRLNRPTSGSILFNGIDLMKMSKKELREFRRHKVAMVFQSFGLLL